MIENQYDPQIEAYLSNLNVSREEFTSQERMVLQKIVNELEKSGKSKTLESLYYKDYEEIPVSMEQFLYDPAYLGNSSRGGDSIYPEWSKFLIDIFEPGRDLLYILFSGAIGTGKSSTACRGVEYVLYNLLCLKDPTEYYQIDPGSRPGIALFNITLDKGYGVAFHKINYACLNSPWFMRHGYESGRGENKIYIPDKYVTITVGSNSEHFIGLDTFCLSGETLIPTSLGIRQIKDLVGKEFKVYSQKNKKDKFKVVQSEPTTAIISGKTDKLYNITLDDGTIIKCTKYHKFRDRKGRYIEAVDLRIRDILMGMNYWDEKIITNIEIIQVPPTEVYDIVNVKPFENFLIKTKSNSGCIVSHNCTMMDEISFKDRKELDYRKMKAYESFTAITRRMESRFMDKGAKPGKVFIVSSTRDEDDFLTQFKETRRGRSDTVIAEKTVWDVKPEKFGDERFHLAMSNTGTNAYILESEDEVAQYESDPTFNVFEIPIEYKESFKDDLDGSIRDILGQPTKNVSLFLYENKIKEAIDGRYKNCLNSTEVKIGFNDSSSILDYIDLSNINPKLIHYPLFVHHDLALGKDGDAAGTAIIAVANDAINSDLSNSEETDSWKFIPVMWCAIRSTNKGVAIPFYKIRDCITDLRDKYGFNILAISADGYQSVEMLQQYTLKGYNTFQISMDKPPSTPYMFFRTCLYTKKLIFPNDELVYREASHLVENKQLQKVDHNLGGTKDVIDCFGGAMYCAVEYNRKSKIKLFEDGGFLFSDVQYDPIEKVNQSHSNVNPTPTQINNEVDAAIRDMENGLFDTLGDDFFPIL